MIDPGDMTTCDADVLKAAEAMQIDGSEPWAAQRLASSTGKDVHVIEDSLYRLREIGMLNDEKPEEGMG